MAGNIRKVFILFAVALVVIATIETAAAEYTNVQPCNEVCPRPQDQLNECCRAHGYKSDGYCANGRHAKCRL